VKVVPELDSDSLSKARKGSKYKEEVALEIGQIEEGGKESK